MFRKRSARAGFSAVLLAGVAAAALLAAAVPAQARDGGDGGRVRFQGRVEAMPPAGLHGTWVIGGRAVTTNPRTEFDQQDGPLMMGGCARVDIRNGLVHEIDSEPSSNCP